MGVANDPDEKAYEQALSRWKVGLAVVLIIVVILGALLAEGTSGFSVWAVWAPVFAISGLFLCALCITSVGLCKKEFHAQGEDDDKSIFERFAHGEFDDNFEGESTPREDAPPDPNSR